jgi:hypothetical protein
MRAFHVQRKARDHPDESPVPTTTEPSALIPHAAEYVPLGRNPSHVKDWADAPGLDAAIPPVNARAAM